MPYLLEIEIQFLQNVYIYIISMDKTTVKIIKNSKKRGGACLEMVGGVNVTICCFQPEYRNFSRNQKRPPIPDPVDCGNNRFYHLCFRQHHLYKQPPPLKLFFLTILNYIICCFYPYLWCKHGPCLVETEISIYK